MASLTPAKGRWVDIGSGMKVYDHESIQDVIAGSAVPIRSPAPAESSHFNKPRQPERETIGLNTPPPSQKTERSELASNIPKASYDPHDYKLKVPDSQGRKLPRILFRWLVEQSRKLRGL
jgi:hypothetical protein